MINLLCFYFLPLIAVTVMSPKLFSMENIKIYDYNRSVVKRKHVLIAMFIALVPVINIVISTVSLALYGALIAEHLTKDEGWLDQPFKRKNKD